VTNVTNLTRLVGTLLGIRSFAAARRARTLAS
jgi:hypothetical protein